MIIRDSNREKDRFFFSLLTLLLPSPTVITRALVDAKTVINYLLETELASRHILV